MAKLLKAQTDAIEAQTQVAAAQHLPCTIEVFYWRGYAGRGKNFPLMV
jgi:hypothetical protein